MKNSNSKNKMRVTIQDDFMNLEMSGDFETLDEAREFYSNELDTLPEEINIIRWHMVN